MKVGGVGLAEGAQALIRVLRLLFLKYYGRLREGHGYRRVPGVRPVAGRHWCNDGLTERNHQAGRIRVALGRILGGGALDDGIQPLRQIGAALTQRWERCA